MSGVPKATLRFSDLLDGLTELRKPVGLMVMVYYNERVQIKIGKGKRHIGQSPGETSMSYQLFFPPGVLWMCLIVPVNPCDNMHAVLPPRKTHLSFGVQHSLEAQQSLRRGATICVTNLN